MAKILVTASYGPENATRATQAFHVAKGVVEAGHEVGIALFADATFLLKGPVRDSIQGVGMPPLKDLFQFAVERGVRVYV